MTPNLMTNSALVETMNDHARMRGAETALVFTKGELERIVLTYRELDDAARGCAGRLLDVCAKGGHVLLPMRTNPSSVVALLGCLYAGLACAPLPVPSGEAGIRRLRALATSPQCVGLVAAAGDVPKFAASFPVPIVVIDEGPLPRRDYLPERRNADLALIQYTSGSQTDPKGVKLTYGNLVANLEMLRTAFGVGPDDGFASWLPLFHDMGLAMLLMPLYFGRPGILMPPTSFVRDPGRWLRTIAMHGVTITGAPNFAYEVCARRIGADTAAGLDLSRLRLAFNGSEPVRLATMRSFAERFAPAGFHPETFFPCYGLAEAVTFVSGGHVAPEDLLEHAHTPFVTPDPVACGTPAIGSAIVVVDVATLRPVPDGVIGEVCVAGPHVGVGYLDQPEASAAIFDFRLDARPGLRFLRTGDLGSIEYGRLTIGGRLKDIIVHCGVNLHAVDIEVALLASHPHFGAAAAFATESDGSEEVVVVQEIARGVDVADPVSILRSAEEVIALHIGVRPFDLVLVRAGVIPKTTSGKVRRDACRRLYEAGLLQSMHSSRQMREDRLDRRCQ